MLIENFIRLELDFDGPHSVEPNFLTSLQNLRRLSVDSPNVGILENLRETYKYFYQFFQHYGTHYVHSATMGGTIFIESSTELDSESDREKMETEASVYFSNAWASAKASASQKTQQESSKLKSKSSMKFKSFGGDPLAASMMNQDSDMAVAFRYWLSTITEKPNVARFQLKPLFSMLPSQYGQLKTQMKIAMDFYLQRVPPSGFSK
jgi:hypothetical protein